MILSIKIHKGTRSHELTCRFLWTRKKKYSSYRGKYLELRPDHAGEAIGFCPVSARLALRDTVQSQPLETANHQLRSLAQRKGSFAPDHAARPRQIPPPPGRYRSRRGTAGGAYPQPLDAHGRPCRPGFRAAPGPTGGSICPACRCKRQGGSSRLSQAITGNPFQACRRADPAAGRNRS